MTYRMEIDALNALVVEQKKTNELLEKIIEIINAREEGTKETTKRGRQKNADKS